MLPNRFHLLACLLFTAGVNAFAQHAQGEYAPLVRLTGRDGNEARVIVKFKPDAAMLRVHALSTPASTHETEAAVSARASNLSSRMGIALRAGRALTADSQVIHADGMGGDALAQRLAAQPEVEYAVVDQRRTHFAQPSDPLYAAAPEIVGNTGGPAVGQWYLRSPTAEVLSSINASKAWELSTGSSSIVVAVLDTGVRPEHPDLVGRLLPGYDMVSDAAAANDGDGRDADGSDPGDWVTQAKVIAKSEPFPIAQHPIARGMAP